jgi:hypothetical protein
MNCGLNFSIPLTFISSFVNPVFLDIISTETPSPKQVAQLHRNITWGFFGLGERLRVYLY